MANGQGTGRFTLIQQNDTHAQLDLHWELFWHNGAATYRRVGGYGRAATVANAIKRETGAAVLVDCGDAIHGSAPAMHSKGQAIVPVLNTMGVDLMTPGNWEYGFGPEVLQQRVAEMDFPVIACNLQHAADGERLFEPYVVRELGGVRVGFVGLTSPIIPQMSPRFAAGLRFPEVQRSLPRCIAKLRQQEGVDLVVVVSHLGFAQDTALAHDITGIDVILSGHTHNRLDRPALVGRTLIIQSGFSGSFLGRLDLEVVRGTIVDHQHELITLEEAIEPDAAVQTIVDEQIEPFRSMMAEVAGHTLTPLHRMALLETTMDNLITDAYLDLTGADLAISHGWRFAPPVPAGAVTVGDLWTMIPTNPEVFTARLSGAEIHDMLEENMHHVLSGDPLEQAGGYLLRVSGLSVVFRPNNVRGTRIEQLEIAGEPYDPRRSYTVAAAGGQDLRQARDQQPSGVQAIDAVHRYLASHDPVSADLTYRKFVAQ